MNGPHEISPLLSKSRDSQLDNGDVLDQRLEQGSPINEYSEQSNDEETQEAEGNRKMQYEGLPEVKKQMRFILPAVAIGVSPLFCTSNTSAKHRPQIFLSAADQTIVASAYGAIGSDLNALNKISWISTV